MDFRIGFAVENYSNRKGIDDSRFVEWDVGLVTNTDGVETKQPVEYRKCTDEDMKAFFPTAPKSLKSVKAIRERDNLFCLADYEKIRING